MKLFDTVWQCFVKLEVFSLLLISFIVQCDFIQRIEQFAEEVGKVCEEFMNDFRY